MSSLGELRELLYDGKIKADGQGQRQFLPNGSLDQILHETCILEILHDSSFRIDPHKLDSTVEIVSKEGRKVFAILVELRLEHALAGFIENDILDKALPAQESKLAAVLEFDRRRNFLQRQWEYLAYNFTGDMYQRALEAEMIIPYLKQTEIGGGGFSTVYDVLVHPAHQNIDPKVKEPV